MGASCSRPDPESGLLAAGSGTDRRTFLKSVCLAAAAAVGLPAALGQRIAEAAVNGLKPSVIWLHFQECTGCTESLLRTSHPALSKLILDLISLDYHETLFAAAGSQCEEALHAAMEANAGKYVCVVEGAIPTADGGNFCKIAGRSAVDMLRDVTEGAGAIVAIGSCAAFGGLPAADPNPTGAKGAPEILTGRTVVTIPGCPPNPYNFLGTVLQYVALGSLPALDELGRPRFAYGETIHECCPRRPHFDAGRFAKKFGDDGHREGYCLYELGCKGPQTHANCSTRDFCEIGAWPIGIGHPCVGCTEQAILWRTAIHETVRINDHTPPAFFPGINPDRPGISPVATGLAGLVGGGLIGATLMGARKLSHARPADDGAAPSGPEGT